MKFQNYTHFLMKHIRWILIGCLFYFVASRINYKKIKYYIPAIVVFTWFSYSCILLNPSNRPSRSIIIAGRNWLTTSDLARIMLIAYTAYFLDKYQSQVGNWKFMLQHFTPVFGITLFMILLQPDLSSTFIIGAIISLIY